LGGRNIAGDKMKEKGTGHWNSPNTSATNESEFTALPGGLRSYIRDNSSIIEDGLKGMYAYFWSATEPHENCAKKIILIDRSSEALGDDSMPYGGSEALDGYSVRCIKD